MKNDKKNNLIFILENYLVKSNGLLVGKTVAKIQKLPELSYVSRHISRGSTTKADCWFIDGEG
jgi:hypothetical protein